MAGTTMPGPASRLYLFGPMRIDVAGASTTLTGVNAQRLVGYLALHPRVAQRREALADALWPDAPASTARRSLSDTLYRLRRVMPEPWLDTVGDTVSLATEDRVWVDVWDFDRLAAGGTRTQWDAAIALYTADLLPGLYDEWVLGPRASRQAAFVAALEAVVADDESAGDLQQALTGARRLIAVAPLHEGAHQTYLRLLGRLRRFGEAATHLEQLEELYASELGVAPMAETRRIVAQMLDERSAPTDVDDRSAFVGRATERSEALQAVEAACAGRGSILAIEGEAGIGKSRLLDEVLRGARWRGALTLAGEVRDVPEAAPLAPLSRALEPVLVGGSLAQIESRLDPAVRVTLGQLHAPWSDVAPRAGTTMGTEQLGSRQSSALRALGRTLAEVGPAVLALDDMHWAGADLWRAVAALADGFVPGGGLLVLAYRRPGIETTEGWADLQGWDRAGLLGSISLAPFGTQEIAELLPTGDADPREVLAVTGGVPFWVAQWTMGAAASHGEDRLSLVRRRIEALPPAQRAALEGAAVLGECVPFGAWTDVTECSSIDLASLGEQLSRGHWVRPSPAGYEFTHDLIRVTVYDQIAPSSRQSLHELAATALAAREPDNLPTRAYHLDRAGHRLEAAECYRRAADRSVATYAMREAVDAYARSFELQPVTARRARLDVGLALAKACESVNDYDRQRPALAVATELAHELGDDAALMRARLIAGLAASRTGDPDASVRFLSDARLLAEQTGDERGVVDATYLLADLWAQQGQWQAAEAAWLPVLEYARRTGDLTLVGCVLRGLAIAAKQTGKPEAAARLLEDSLAVLRDCGDRVNELYTSSNLLGVLYDLEAWDRLLDHADEMWPVAELFGDPVTIGVVRHQQGLAAMALGDQVTARAMMVEAKEAFGAAERPRMVGLVVNTIGLVAEDEGRDAEAEVRYREALATALAHDAAVESAYARHDLGALLARTGRAGEAIPLLRSSAGAWADLGNDLLRAKSEAVLGLALLSVGSPLQEATVTADAGVAMVRAGVPAGEQPQGWLWALTRLLQGLGRAEDAAAVLDAARAELDRQALAISSTDRRRQFFERVPVNRAIVSAHTRQVRRETTRTVELARRDAPLGRTLREEERVVVHWTLHAPDDDAVGDKGAQRRHRLLRLVEEAAAAGAAPTDGDLAAALGVSRRTILRDIERLAATEPMVTTRRRSRQRSHPTAESPSPG
jgi:DNA-binding SARP family transcriptional activator